MKSKEQLLKIMPFLPVLVSSGIVASLLSGCCLDCPRPLFPTARQLAQADAAARLSHHAGATFFYIQSASLVDAVAAAQQSCPRVSRLSESQIELDYGSGCTTEMGQTYRGRVRITQNENSAYTVEYSSFGIVPDESVNGVCTLRQRQGLQSFELAADMTVQTPRCAAQFTLQGDLAPNENGSVRWNGTGIYTSGYPGRTVYRYDSLAIGRDCPTPLSGRVQVSSDTAVAYEMIHTGCGAVTLHEGMNAHSLRIPLAAAYPCQPPANQQ